MFRQLRRYYLRKKYRPGRELSQFLAPDIRRDIKIVGADEIDSDIILAKVRTWNVLHVSKGLAPMPDFGEPRRVSLNALWEWSSSHSELDK